MFTLDNIVPWGRSLDEYRRMFALTDADLRRRLLACADGPASFNAELAAAGGKIISCDPIYRLSAAEIRQRIDESSAEVIEQARRNAHEFVWSDRMPDVEALARHRFATMERFLEDYEAGRDAGRYVSSELPDVPFENDSFDLAVCSHFLFLYGEQLSFDFHVESIRRMVCVAAEVRLFPLVEMGGLPSRHAEEVMAELRGDGCRVSVEMVDYEFQRGGNQMMRIRR